MLLRKIITVPSGTSEVERSFSSMNYILSQRSSLMSDKHLEDRLRLSINGHNNLDQIPFSTFTRKWVIRFNPSDLESFREAEKIPITRPLFEEH